MKYAAHPDRNHAIPREVAKNLFGAVTIKGEHSAYEFYYRGFHILLIDAFRVGGIITDYIMQCVDNGRVMWLEVKFEGKENDLRDGQKKLQSIVGNNFAVIVTDEDFIEAVKDITTLL